MKKLAMILLTLTFMVSCGTTSKTVNNSKSKDNFVSFAALSKFKDGKSVANAPLDKTVKYQLILKPKLEITEAYKQKSIKCLKSFNNSEFILENNKYLVITEGLTSSLGDEKMSISFSIDNARVNLSTFNGRFLNDFANFVLSSKSKDIKKSTEEISTTETKVDKNNNLVELITKSKFMSKLLNQFIEHKKDNYISCIEYDIEDSIFNKLKDTENKLTKEEIHNYLDQFIKNRRYKVTVIK